MVQWVLVAAALTTSVASGWAQSNQGIPAATASERPQPAAPKPVQVNPAAGGVHLKIGPLQMTGWDASQQPAAGGIHLTVGPLQMTGWDASQQPAAGGIHLTIGPLQMTGSAK